MMTPKAIRWVLAGIFAYIIICHGYNLFYVRSMWLDEWFTVLSMKFTTSGLFDILSPSYVYGGMDFPRLHMFLLRAVGELGNFSNFSLHLVPMSISAVALGLLIRFSVRCFGYSFWALLFTVCIASNRYTIHNFTQLKHYPMEVLGTTVCLIHFLNYIQRRNENRPLNGGFMVGSIFTFILWPWLSISYGIVAAPLLTIMTIDFFRKGNYRKPLAILLLAFAASAGFIFLKHYLQFLSSKNLIAYGYINEKFDPDRILHSLKNLFFFFSLGSMFPDPGPSSTKTMWIASLRFFAAAIAVFGVYRLIAVTRLKELFSSPLKLEHYFLVLFCIIFPLYFARKLPLAYDRSDYFFLPITAYLFIYGARELAKTLGSRPSRLVFQTSMAVFFVLHSIYFVKKHGNELVHENRFYSQRLWDQSGAAVLAAYHQSESPKILISNQFGKRFVEAGGFAMSNAAAVLLVHPYYDRRHPILIDHLPNDEICRRMILPDYHGTIVVNAEGDPVLGVEFCKLSSST